MAKRPATSDATNAPLLSDRLGASSDQQSDASATRDYAALLRQRLRRASTAKRRQQRATNAPLLRDYAPTMRIVEAVIANMTEAELYAIRDSQLCTVVTRNGGESHVELTAAFERLAAKYMS